MGARAGDPGAILATHLGDLDCSAFPMQADAQEHYEAHPGDPDRLDEDGDGLACEDFLPCPCRLPFLTSNTSSESDPSPTQTPDVALPPALPASGGPRDSGGLGSSTVLLGAVLGFLAMATSAPFVARQVSRGK
jgi:hypothetical protein